MKALDTETTAFRMQLNRGQAVEYRKRHTEMWPELRQALIAAGITHYRIFLDPEFHHLFAVLEHRKVHGMDTLRQSELMQRWWRMMRDIMATNVDDSPVEVPLQSMFELTP